MEISLTVKIEINNIDGESRNNIEYCIIELLKELENLRIKSNQIQNLIIEPVISSNAKDSKRAIAHFLNKNLLIYNN